MGVACEWESSDWNLDINTHLNVYCWFVPICIWVVLTAAIFVKKYWGKQYKIVLDWLKQLQYNLYDSWQLLPHDQEVK